MGTIERTSILLTLVAVAGLTAYASLRAMEDDKKPPVEDPPPRAAAAPRPEAKPLSDQVKKGIDFLVEHQLPNGGWAQGEEAAAMRGGGSGEPATVANVGDTCISALALIRAGNTPKEGTYDKNVARAVAFVTAQVEKSAADDLSVTDVKNTRLQSKLGPYVDTFLTSMLLAEVKGKMPSPESEKNTVVALDRVIHKITKNQKADGTWTDAGWAPVLAQSLAGKGLNRAAQMGTKVEDRVLALAEKNARDNLKPAADGTAVATKPLTSDPVSVSFARESAPAIAGGAGGLRMAGDANVPLYGFAANAAAGQDAINTRKLAEADLKKVADDPKAPKEEREKAQTKLKDLETNAKAQEEATKAVVQRLGDKQFIQGFGSNGGEEFLSYMQISETLLAKGGKEWQDWDKSMTENLGRIQNPDGSWSGHHCITGRTFCTATALLVLMADRAPVPVPKADPKK
ncbi:MAG TPA: prenyltransferase/squalene oxidase repeat-containing protein [Gemmataceae bacterium]|nr:prenyltransferase/squalene oxidase repeat-containing protein [Gemmataceae bacterium]